MRASSDAVRLGTLLVFVDFDGRLTRSISVDRKPQLDVAVGFACGHLAVVGLVVHAGEMQQAVEQQDLGLRRQASGRRSAAWRAAVSSEMARSPAWFVGRSPRRRES